MDEDNPKKENEMPAAAPKGPSLLRNYLSFIGLGIVAASLTSIGLLILMEITAAEENPYTALVTYILLPGVLFFGLALVLVGALIERRRRRKSPDSHIPAYPIIDLNDPARRRSLLIFLCLGFVFLFISAFGSYHAYEYTE